MSSSLLGLAHVLTAALASACPTGPVDWSRDGRWIAWTSVEAADAPALPRDWLMPAPNSSERLPATPSSSRRLYRVRTTKFPSLESVLIEESPHPLSSPGWSPDGRTMAYTRFVSSDPDSSGLQRGRFEVAIRSGLDRTRVVVIDPGLRLDAEARSSLPAKSPALSSDGRRVAVPRPGTPAGFWVVLLDDSGAVMAIDEASTPVWSPDGRRLAYFKFQPSPTGEVRAVPQVMPPVAHADRPVGGLENSFSPEFLAWSPDGLSLLAIASPMRGALRSSQLDLVRVSLDGSMLGRLSNLESVQPVFNPQRRNPAQVPRSPQNRPASLRIELTMDANQEEGVCLIETDGRDQLLRWGDLSTQNTFKRFHPLDPGLRIDAPALAPDGRTLAFRVDDGTGAGLLALIDPSSEEVSLVSPDEATRRRWLDRLAGCALMHLGEWLPGGEAPAARPTALPLLRELGGLQPRRQALARLSRFASPLLKEQAPGDGLDDFRLFFSYLDQDYDSASRWLDAVESGCEDPTARLRWLGLRAQILLGEGQLERARGIVDYITRETRPIVARVEETAGGFSIANEPHPEAAWADHLRRTVSESASRLGNPSHALDRTDRGETEDPFADIQLQGRDRLPGLPFAPPPPDDREIVPIAPDDMNPPGLPPGGVMLPPVPGGVPGAAIRRFRLPPIVGREVNPDALIRLEVEE